MSLVCSKEYQLQSVFRESSNSVLKMLMLQWETLNILGAIKQAFHCIFCIFILMNKVANSTFFLNKLKLKLNMLAATASLEAARLIISSTEQACFLLKFIGYVCYTSLYMKLMYMHEFLHGYCLVFY